MRLDTFADVDWSMVSGQFLTFAAVVVMAVVGSGLNLSGAEPEVGNPLDADRDFRAVGLSTLLAAPTGGLVGSILIFVISYSRQTFLRVSVVR